MINAPVVPDCWRITGLRQVDMARIIRLGPAARPAAQSQISERVPLTPIRQTGQPFIVLAASLLMSHLFPMIAAVACSFLARSASSRRTMAASSLLGCFCWRRR